MVIFGDEDNMVERFVEIDARVFLEGTAHIASGFCWKPQKTRVFAAISLRSKVLKEALKTRFQSRQRTPHTMPNSLYMPDSHFIDAISVHASIIILATVFLTNDAAFGQLPGLQFQQRDLHRLSS